MLASQKYFIYLLLVMSALLGFQQISFAQNPNEWKFTVNQKDSLTVGDTITYSLSRSYFPNSAWSFSIDSTVFSAFEISPPETSLTTSGDYQLIQHFVFWGHQNDTLKSIKYVLHTSDNKNEVYFSTPPLFLFPKFFAASTDTSLRAEKDIYSTHRPWWQYALWSLLVLLLGFLLYYLYRQYVKKKTELKPEQLEGEVQKSPYEIFTERMVDLLEEKQTWDTDVKIYYSKLTEIVKEYLELKYKTHVLEMTTDELLGWVETEPSVIQNMTKLHDVLSRADLIKFAKQQTVFDQMLSDYDYIKNSVEQIDNTPRFRQEEDNFPISSIENENQKEDQDVAV